ncbi:MAG: cupin domain-containing protein [Rhodobacter sp.]|nr:cupin domain-containing protein [Rhodobacter sp.]
MPKIDIDRVALDKGSSYPEPYAAMMAGRGYLPLGDAGGLTQFGANITVLDPGGTSSMRHWHEQQDEFVLVTEGEVVLVEDQGETVMRPGDCAAFPAGVANGHHFVNRSDIEARFLVIGTRTDHEIGHYSDVDMRVEDKDGVTRFTTRDGTLLKEIK